MKLMPEYAQNIIVCVVFQNTWKWYITEREYWFLNVEMEDRFGIEVLDESTAARFLHQIQDLEVPVSELANMLTELEAVFQSYDDVLEFIPAMYVNFDDKVLYSLFPEPMSFEHYVPAGWTGEYLDFLNILPADQQYWMIQGTNFFENMYARWKPSGS
ncbi:hypothetical protein ACTHPF_02515 [Paenibacillus sp. SAF-054]|uniref:hypothetical protein n=1 Tax=unclassified Paenibacillus TaxID=185978 RepID=UPI003F7CD74C